MSGFNKKSSDSKCGFIQLIHHEQNVIEGYF